MARSVRSSKLETRSTRLKLPVAKKPTFVKIGPRLGLGYRRNQTSGTWVIRVADGKGGNWTKVIGAADDFEDANGGSVLDFWQAQDKARVIASVGRDGAGGSTRPATVGEALDRYESDLKTRGGDTGNVFRVRVHLTEALSGRSVALLTARDLRSWRDALIKVLAPSTVNRTCAAFKAALNLSADHDEHIASRRAWETGLASIPDAEQSRNIILPESAVRDLIAAAQAHSAQFGLLVEVAATTGARVSQLSRLEVQDLQGDRSDPRLMMPTSRKGKGTKKIMRRPVPIPVGLAARLGEAAADRSPNASLLVKPSGAPWKKSDHSRLFNRS